MVRKRSAYDRWKDRSRKRRRQPPPKEGWLLAEFARLGGVTPRTVRYYLEKDLLPSPSFFGTATRYPRSALLLLLAIQRMKSEEHLPLDAIKKRLAHMEAQAIEAYAIEKLGAGPTANALGVARTPPTPSTLGELEKPPTYKSVPWELVQLLPGLALMVYAGASPHVKKLAQQIYDHCASAAPATTVAP
ncbi:MAG: MerR family transcriptional regulator [Polyangiaceae bacterium]